MNSQIESENHEVDVEEDLEMEYEEEDAGASLAMSRVFTFEERLPYLLIHGMLHLLGYDHETDAEWTEMTAREDDVINQLHLHSDH